MDENTLTLLTRYAGVVSLKRKLLDRVVFSDSLSFSSGRYLVTDYNGTRVILFNNEGKRIWEYTGCRGPWDAVWLPDGKILVSSCNDGSLTVFSEDGKLIKQLRPGLRSPRGLVVLDNGNYLVAEYSGGCLAEVTPDGKIKERYFSGDVQGPMALRMTQNGNFIVAERRARRVTIRSLKTKKTLWSKDGLNSVYGVQQLGNGCVAVSWGASLVRVYDADGKERWNVNTRCTVYDVGVTAAGDAIIPVLKTVGGKNVIVLTECSCDDGKVLREVPLEGAVSGMASLVQE
jgi:WD40 repeat protein